MTEHINCAIVVPATAGMMIVAAILFSVKKQAYFIIMSSNRRLGG
jgi:hypothetical protein